MTYGDEFYGGAPYGGTAVPPTPVVTGGILLVGVSKPTDYQIAFGTRLPVWVAPTEDQDVHVAQVAYRGNAVASTDDTGWVLHSRVSSGTTIDDIAEDIWIKIAPAAGSRKVVFEFTESDGEKWVGVQTLRGVDTTELMVTGIAGTATGNEFAPLVRLGILYSYSQLLQALVRGELGAGYSYSKIVQDLQPDKFAAGYAYSKLVQDLQPDKGAFFYSYSNVEEPLP